MQYRQAEPTTVITLDLADVLQEQRWIEVGPDATPFEITAYQHQVTERVQELAASSPVFAKLARGEQLDADELDQALAMLNQPDLFADEEALQRAWRAPHASFVSIVRHILGVAPLVSREDAINAAFSAFLADKSYLQADQLTFVRLFVRRLIDAGRIVLADLYDHPFTTLTTDPEKLLPLGDLDEMLVLAQDFEVR
jgi:type I restriction enzyme, R subunit